MSVSAHSAGAYTATLLVMVNVMKGGGGLHPPPSPAWVNFTLMIECTPESNRCYRKQPLLLCVLILRVVATLTILNIKNIVSGPTFNTIMNSDQVDHLDPCECKHLEIPIQTVSYICPGYHEQFRLY